MSRGAWLALCLVVCLAWLEPSQARAAFLEVYGESGADGAIAPSPSDPGGDGGAGGDAVADVGSSDPKSFAHAEGGRGGSGAGGGLGGAGGAATALATSTAANADAVSAAMGGRGGTGGAALGASAPGAGGAGGFASSEAIAHGSDYAYATAGATAGDGGSSDGVAADGAAAQARAEAHSDLGVAFADVGQLGGAGGSSPTHPGRGADSILLDAVTGSSPVLLSLSQSASGGAGGQGPGSRGGDARSELDFTNDSNGETHLQAFAQGGNASGTAAGPARAGDSIVVVHGVDHTGKLLDVQGRAIGAVGFGENAQAGVTSVSANGVSTAGGDVSVSGVAVGGAGVTSDSIDLVDVVTGDTSGALYLQQEAVGGSTTTNGGAAGSHLHRSGSFASLYVTTIARGGATGTSFGGGTFAPADGVAESQAANDAGPAYATAMSSGGGSVSGQWNVGDGESTADSLTTGDGHLASAFAQSQGGGSSFILNGPTSVIGAGRSVATATALGNSPAEARSTAFGGTNVGPGLAVVARGDAFARASAQGGGAADVSAYALGQGGDVPYATVGTVMGTGTAESLASGFGQVTSTAVGFGDAASSAVSDAYSAGAVRSVHGSLATFGGQSSSWVKLGAESDFRVADTRARAQALYLDGSFTHLVTNAAPSAADVATFTEPGVSPNVDGSLTQATSVLALGTLRANDGISGSLDLALDPAELPAGDDLVLGFRNASLSTYSPYDFDVLSVQISVAGSTVADWSFPGVLAAAAGLGDALLVVAPGGVGGGVETLSVRWTLATGPIEFASDFVLFTRAVPEPPVTLLVALALGLFARTLRARIG